MKKPDPLRGKLAELQLVSLATDRELDDFTTRDSAMQSRASILIGAASLVGAFKLGTGIDWLVVVSLALAVLAAVCGVIVLWPRSSHGPNPRHLWKELKGGLSQEEGLDNMIRVKLDALEADEKSLARRSGWAVTGFLLLVASVALSVLAVGIGVSNPAPGDSPSSEVTVVD